MKQGQKGTIKDRTIYGEPEKVMGWGYGSSHYIRPVIRVMTPKEAHEKKMPNYTKLNK